MKWFERKFPFGMPAELLPNVLERLRGAPARLEEKLLKLSREVRVRKNGDEWSIQEHAGHLVDLDELHYARLLDYEAGVETLRPADLQNRKTYEARHNERDPKELCAEFRREREKFVKKIEGWPKEMWLKTALHPRLKQPMRVIDLCVFVAEHDDHHLMRMTELSR
jgi:uncharacterized damage-inducible protein DinB